MITLPAKASPKALRDALVHEHSALHEQVSQLRQRIGALETAAARSSESDRKLKDAQRLIYLLLSDRLERAALDAADEYAALLENDAKPLEEGDKKKEAKK